MMKKNKKIKYFLRKSIISIIALIVIFPFNVLVVLADPVPVEEVGANLEENTITAEVRIPQNNSSVVSNTNSIMQLLGEIMAPVYQLATPGSNLTYDIYRYLMKHTENELGIDKDIFRRMERKQTAPTVDIVFAPTNPKEGEKVTAIAVPRGFRNDAKKLYYTWYIVHDALTGDEKPNVEAGKKEAMRMVAAGNYDKQLFYGGDDPEDKDLNRDAYDASFGGDDGIGKRENEGTAASEDCSDRGCDCLNEMSMMNDEVTTGCFDDKGVLLYSGDGEYEEAMEDRGDRSANVGRGVVNSKWITRCYRHNFGAGGDRDRSDKSTFGLSGRDLIIKCQHAFGDEVGDRKFEKDEELDWGTNPEDADTDGDGVMDEADLAGLGQSEFTWIYRKGDKVSVAVEGMSNIAINEGSTDRLRYKNKKWEITNDSGEKIGWDLSPTASPETWYTDARGDCEDGKNKCLAKDGDSLLYVPVEERLGDDSKCTSEYADCMKRLWEHERKSENDEDAFGSMTGYYKIMWAAPGICSGNKVDEAKNDWCDTDDDIGFQYLKLVDPVEQGKQLLEVSVNVSPKNPQFSEADIEKEGDFSVLHSDSTDMIIASAGVNSQEYVNPDYLYYKWSVWRCYPEDFDKCEDVTKQVDFKSRTEGLGLRDIGFYPVDTIFTISDRTLLKIGVVVKKHKGAVMSSPGINGEYTKQIFSDEKKEIEDEDEYVNKYAYSASKLIEVTKNEMEIKFYQATIGADGAWVKGDEICGDNSEKAVYRKLCPVYQYQVIAAEVENAGDSLIWKVNGNEVGPTLNGLNNTEPNDPIIFFPIAGNDGQLITVEVVSDKEDKEGLWDDDNMMESRVLTIHRPMVRVLDNKKNILDGKSIQKAFYSIHNYGGGPGKKRSTVEDLWWVMGDDSKKDRVVNVPIVIIPRYLKDEIDQKYLVVKASANGNDMGDVFPDNPTEFEKIVLSGEVGKLNSLKMYTLKKFDYNYRKALEASFGLEALEELVDVQSVRIKTIDADIYYKATGQVEALNFRQKTSKFFASTIKNAPEYFVFILRLAVSFVLVTMIAFGMSYGAKRIS
jgi:hypothetical protein